MFEIRKRDCQNCIWHDISCTKFSCQQITRSQITKVLDYIEICDETIDNNPSAKDVAKIVTYEYITRILKGGHNDKAGS